jgi:hypothetical protein
MTALPIDPAQMLAAFGALLGMIISLMFAGGRLLVGQFERRLDEKFSAQEALRASSQKHWDTKFSAIERVAASEAKEWQRMERELMSMKADLPVMYVRRDDYIRNQSVIEAKIDGLAIRIENAMLKGDR